MRPTIGIVGKCPPLCQYYQLTDGTYTIADVKRFNNVIDGFLD